MREPWLLHEGGTRGMSKRGLREGSIYKRADGYWVGAMSDGGRRRKVVYAKTRTEIAEKMKALLRGQQQGMPLTTERLTVASYLTKWSEGAKTTVRASTWYGYNGLI